MKSRKIETPLAAGVILLFAAVFLSGCGSEPEETETATDSKEIKIATDTDTESIQDVETIIEPMTDTDETQDAPASEEYGRLDDQESLETETGDEFEVKKDAGSSESILQEFSDTAEESIDATEETVTETTDTIVETTEDEVASIEDTIADIQEDTTSELESMMEEPVAQTEEDAQELVAATPDLIRRVQQALANEGYNPGPVDGIEGPRTLSALNNFQEDNNLSSGELTKETLRALDVSF